MKFWKKALIITGSFILIFGFGYFIGHAVEMSKTVSYDSICYKTYLSLDSSYQLEIFKDNYIRFISKEDYLIHQVEYSNNFLRFTAEEIDYEFYVFNKETVYSKNFNTYLYLYEVSE